MPANHGITPAPTARRGRCAWGRLSRLGPLLLAAAAGCTLITQPRKEDLAYENAQREINGPNENWSGVRQASYEEEQRRQEMLEEEKKGFELSDLDPSKINEKLKEIRGKGRNPEAARALYDEADRLYRQGIQAQGEERKRLLLQAAGRYAEAAERWPGSTRFSIRGNATSSPIITWRRTRPSRK
jgi:hypothetical protein